MPTTDPTDEIERLAAAIFSTLPLSLDSSAPGTIAPRVVAASPVTTSPVASPGATPMPAVGPSALVPRAGGASTAQALPPTPGPLQTMPIASAPAPKESDLRNALTTIPQAFGMPSFALATDERSISTTAPYFLEGSGLPGAPPPSVPEPEAPAVATPDLDLVTPSLEAESVPDPGVEPGLFDPHVVRAQFPILQERVHGRRLVWLDNAATTQKPRSVIERLTYYYEHENSNVHRAAHALAARATDAYEAAREKVRRFLNAPRVEDIVFVRGTTEAINLVAQSWGRRHVKAGDKINLTHLEHHANIVPWQQLARATGARLCVAPVDRDGQVLLDEFEKKITKDTRIATFAHVSNALGTILPVREMIEMAHRNGVPVLVDGAQAVSHMPVDVQALDCDFYCFSGHKIFGPTGIGVLYGKAGLLEHMPPWQGGGNMIKDVTFEKTTYQGPPVRYEAGTANIADAVGLGEALDWLERIGRDAVARYEHELLGYATESLLRVPGLRIIGTAPEKAGVISFVVDGVPTESIGEALDREGIAVRAGHHCAQPIHRRFGLESTVRASLAPYNTREDIDALASALLRMLAEGPGRRGL